MQLNFYSYRQFNLNKKFICFICEFINKYLNSFNIFFDDKISLIQHQIFLLSIKLNFRLIKNKQRFLAKSFSARILSVRNYIESDISGNSKKLSSKEKFNIVSLLYYKQHLYKYYNFYVIKSNKTSFSFNFFIIYSSCFCWLVNFSILPFLETLLDKSFFKFRPYKWSSDLVIEMQNVILSGFNKFWYLKVQLFNTLNHTNKFWLLKNFPLGKVFLNFCFERKNSFFCKYFYLIVFNYLLKGLLRIIN